MYIHILVLIYELQRIFGTANGWCFAQKQTMFLQIFANQIQWFNVNADTSHSWTRATWIKQKMLGSNWAATVAKSDFSGSHFIRFIHFCVFKFSVQPTQLEHQYTVSQTSTFVGLAHTGQQDFNFPLENITLKQLLLTWWTSWGVEVQDGPSKLLRRSMVVNSN